MKGSTRTLTYIDLFSGAGGLSMGFENAGYENIFSLDNEPTFCETYRRNFPHHLLIEKRIEDLSARELKNLLKGQRVDVVVGGPPCQGFSMAGNIGRSFTEDPRNQLFKEFARVIGVIQPRYFVMENVSRLMIHNKGETRKEIIASFRKLGYSVSASVISAADFGVPQFRNRAVFIGTHKGIPIELKKRNPKKFSTVREALASLPRLRPGQKSTIPNHEASMHSAQMLKKMSYVKNGGTRATIPKNLRPGSGDSRKYIRYNSERPSVCVTGDMRKIFHYSQNRALTVRELARLQSFPDSFVFMGTRISQQQQVGNAVPPLLAKGIAQDLKSVILNEKVSKS